MLYFISSSPPRAADGKIFTARNATGVVQSGEMHIIDETAHFIHKQDAEPPGWYMRNATDGVDYFLGAGASPTIAVDEIVIHDAELWEKIAMDEETRNAAATGEV